MIALIEYGAGNTASVSNALNSLGYDHLITNREDEIIKADKIIFPGVGEASSAMRRLHMNNLFNLLRIVKKPLLGICLGMQLLCERSLEGDVACLGIFPTESEKFDSTKTKVPHMGWNEIEIKKESLLFSGIENGEYFYFAHSFYLPINNYTTSSAVQDVEFTASMQKDNFYGVQFHPEKSGEVGMRLLKNFVELC
ncbi:MAG: imidazole glycerol phosphate synthase subunit HisH [Bacteroidetes bacterium]|nr:imidazole glycerol phosphate synthase subunit HisH [Bacteroidota bacterium]